MVVIVREHPFFQREGLDLICEVPISFTQAALGAEIQVPTLRNPNGPPSQETVTVQIPEGTQTGTTFTVRGKGMPSLNGHRTGDLIIRTRVCTPTHLSEKQKALLRQFAAEGGEKHSEHRGFWDRIREFLGS